MRDPLEGLSGVGEIRTGVSRSRIPAEFADLVDDLADAFTDADHPGAELHLYGSIVTGMARVGASDLDAVVIDGAPGWAAKTSSALSHRYRHLCRSVEIGEARRSDYEGPGDQAYGNRVFLRHYCVSLAGPDDVRAVTPFPGDRRAARGFNGDIANCLQRWRASGAPAQRVARKALFAAAGIVSVHEGNWTTDRSMAVAAWSGIAHRESGALIRLLELADGVDTAREAELQAALADGGIIHSIAERFGAQIGFWNEPPA
jgi:hypothetical protein